LVETIVSIGLLTLVLSAFVGTVTASLRLTDVGNKKYIAIKIAQEGMELFQSKRNNNVMCIENDTITPCNAIPDSSDAQCLIPQGKDWRYGLYERDVGFKNLPPRPPWRANSYEIDGNAPNSLMPGLTLADFDSTHYLCQQDALSRRYNYCGTPSQYIPGNFTREIRVSPDPTEPCSNIYSPLRVEVIVSWENRSGVRQSVSIEKHLYNTQP
jgi:hypothetical protein